MPYRYIVVLLAIFVAGCDSTSGPSASSVLVPLAINNTWVYQVTDFDSTGAVSEISEYVRKLVDTTTIDGQLYYQLDNLIGFVTNRPDGHWIFVGSPPGWRYAKYPAFVGEIIERDTLRDFSSDPVEDAFVETKLVSNSVSVTVPAGTFIAYQYESIYVLVANGKPIIKEVLYMTPGVGAVRTENHNYLENGTAWVTSRSELKGYTLH